MKKFIILFLMLIPLIIYADNFQIAYDEFPASIGQSSDGFNTESGHILGNIIGVSSDGTYKIKSGLMYLYESISVSIDETNTNEYSDILYENSPNPFNAKTTIRFSISNNSNVEIIVYNIKGQKVVELINEPFRKGTYSVVWHGDDCNGKKVCSGVYLYKLKVNGEMKSAHRCLYVK